MTSRTHVIVNLHKATCAQQSAAAQAAGHRTFFVSAVHPRKLLGILWNEDGYEGAWMENFRIITRIGNMVQVFEAPGMITEDPTKLASWVLAHLLDGSKPSVIQDALDRSTAKTWALVA